MQPTAANGSGTCLKHYAQVWQIYEPAFLAKLEALFRVGRGKASNAPDSVCSSVPSAAAAAGACEDEDAFIEGVPLSDAQLRLFVMLHADEGDA